MLGIYAVSMDRIWIRCSYHNESLKMVKLVIRELSLGQSLDKVTY